MNAGQNRTDHLGQAVQVGDEVRILHIDLGPDMEDDEREMFECMLGSTSLIDRFDADGLAWVTMWWITGEGNATTSVGLAPHQMEKVGPAAG